MEMEISFTFFGEPITVSSPLRDHQESQESRFLPDLDHDQGKGNHENDTENIMSKFHKEVDNPSAFLGLTTQDPYNNHAAVIFNPNPKRKSLLSNEPKKKQRKIQGETSQPQRQPQPQPQPQAPRDLSTEFLRIIEPALPVFLYRKCLSKTDVHRGQNRLLVTEKEKEKLMQFLTSDEERVISCEKNSKIEVTAVDCMDRKFDLRLCTWGGTNQGEASTRKRKTKRGTKTAKRKMKIVFNRMWCHMLEANGVKPEDIAELWGFRRDGKFWLAANFFHP